MHDAQSLWSKLILLLKMRFGTLLIAIAACLLILSAVPAFALLGTKSLIYTSDNVPHRDIGIVFGAGVDRKNGQPTPFLESRLLEALNLYKQQKVNVLLVSGDNSTRAYNEPQSMSRYLIAHGVPKSKIVLDYAGYDTYDTCYRAHMLFGVSSAVLVTHDYHLPRALLTCSRLGIKSIGVAAVKTNYSYSAIYLLREYVSLNKAALELLWQPKPPVLGHREQGVVKALSA